MTQRDTSTEEYIPDPEDEREVPLDDEAGLESPPPTIDPDERIEEIEPDPGGLDDARPV